MGTYECILPFCECTWGKWFYCRCWGHLTTLCCNWTFWPLYVVIELFVHAGGGDPTNLVYNYLHSPSLPFAPFHSSLPPPLASLCLLHSLCSPLPLYSSLPPFTPLCCLHLSLLPSPHSLGPVLGPGTALDMSKGSLGKVLGHVKGSLGPVLWYVCRQH